MVGMRVNASALVPCIAALLTASAVCQTRQFEQHQYRQPETFVATNMPFAVGDVDGDGDLDVLTTQANPWVFSVTFILHRRDANGWQQTFLSTTNAQGIFVPVFTPELVDLDGDGDLDVAMVVVDQAGAITRVEFLENGGAGNFTATAPLPLPNATSADIAFGDFNGDGFMDLIVALAGSPLTVFEHDGSFGFQPVAGATPTTVAAAPFTVDLDGDSDIDVVATAPNGGVLMLVNQNGTFTGTAVAATAAQHVVAHDFDGDGDQDVVAQQGDGTMVLLANTGAGFVATTVADGGALAGQRPELADFDGDLDIDIAFHTDGELRVLRNDGIGSFATERIVSAHTFEVADTDGDGLPDLLFQTSNSNVAVGLAHPDGIVVDPVFYQRPYIAEAIRGRTEDVADFDNDGTIDLIQHEYQKILVRSNRGIDGWSTLQYPVPFTRPRARAGDVDADGDQDIIVINYNGAGGLIVFRNDGHEAFTQLPQQPLTSGVIKGKGDFNGDMQTDLLMSSGSNLLLLLSTGGTFAPPIVVYSGASTSVSSLPGIWDYDGDQDLDLIVRPGSGSCASLLLNDGNANFSVADPCLVTLPGGTVNVLKLVDIDQDGDPDIFTWGYGNGALQINDNGTFTTSQIIQGAYASALLFPWFGDVNDDGYPDLLQLGGQAQVWINDTNGALVLEPGRVISDFSGAGLADLDGDGDNDHIGAVGASSQYRANHLRSATSLTQPMAGGQMDVRYAHEPGFASGNAVCIPLLALQKRYTPLAVPGIRGLLQIDLNTAVAMPYLVFPATTGLATSSFAIPNIPGLLGFDLYAQGLVFAAQPGWTPPVHERVM